MPHKVIENILFTVLWSLTSIVDIVLLPIQFYIQDPINNYRKSYRKRIKPFITSEANGFAGGVRVSGPLERSDECLVDEKQFGLGIWTSVPEWFEYIAKKYANQPCMGTRARLSEVMEEDSSGRKVKKFILDNEYKYITFSEAMSRVNLISQNLSSIGIRDKQIVPIFAESREEWILVSQALWKVNATVATIFSNLGTDGIVHILNITEATHLFTSTPHISKLQDLKRNGRLTHLQTVIYFSDLATGSEPTSIDEFQLISYKQLLLNREDADDNNSSPEESPSSPIVRKGSDVVLIMYTSGSTGTPKGVMITQDNFMGAFRALLTSVVGDYKPKKDEAYLGLLPLAHIYELGCEMTILTLGIPVAFSSPLTMVTGAPALCKGSISDIALIRPTIMPSVPLILERVKKSVEDRLRRKPAMSLIFRFCLQYKLFWYKMGFDTPLIDRYIFAPAQNALGGRIRMMLVGGAPLLEETQAFITLVMNVHLLQGYASTETCGSALLMDLHDRSFGKCGAPLNGTTFRLVEWEEGGYSPRDKPNPRGELYIGGPTVAAGYYKDEEETKNSFITDGKIRYWISGDIAELDPDGTIRIIDRRKGLIKIFNGEYVSLGKVEAILKNCSLVDNICIYGSLSRPYVIALAIPNRNNFTKLVESLGKSDKSFVEQCQDEQVIEAFLNELTNEGKAKGLARYEIPMRVLICPQDWTSENGLVTAALKIRRHEIQKYYAKDIEMLYDGKKSTVPAKNGVNKNHS
ncbi:long-chain-fatty-acid--CoA ligase 4-like [Brevipalpus obovatus]|uniref:long-chain-fatty-acid--CoA ligase 4-like n=1 Tax=Brevipalpus obovatus TaxID=246614 RepID=UPI003D9E15F4